MASVAENIVDNAFGSLSTKPRVQVISLRMADDDDDDQGDEDRGADGENLIFFKTSSH